MQPINNILPSPHRPRGRMLVREAGAYGAMRISAVLGSAVACEENGEGHAIMVIPGFMASDRTTARLRRSLSRAGYRTSGWGLGRNRGIKADILEKLDQQITALGEHSTVTLIGWSLGGLVAREYAKYAPHRIAKVITLGSPFSGDIRANNAWRAYEWVAGHKVDALPIAVTLHEKPPVPTYAFWSASDGVVAPLSACGLIGEADHQIELDCSHMGFVGNPKAIRKIAAIIRA